MTGKRARLRRHRRSQAATASGAHGVASPIEMIGGFADLDLDGLRRQWRHCLGGTPPAHLTRWLLLRILAYRVQAAALGGLDKEMLRILRQPKGHTLESTDGRPFEPRNPTTREGASLRAGARLTREWKGKLETVTVLDKGFAWNGKTYGSLSQVVKAMTGTSWNGHRFFGLRTAKSVRSAKAARNRSVSEAAPPDFASIEPAQAGDGRRRNRDLRVARAEIETDARSRAPARPNAGQASPP